MLPSVNILTAQEIKAWDQYTLVHEPIASIDLMERAAKACAGWISAHVPLPKTFYIFCGKGNNGGDGLALARMLAQSGHAVQVYITGPDKDGTADFETNLQRWLAQAPATFIHTAQDLPMIQPGAVVVDALVGSGLNAPLRSLIAEAAEHINRAQADVISIDLPSGLFADASSKGHPAVAAHTTLTFQCYKPGLLLQENASLAGNVVVLDIGLHPGFLSEYDPKRKWVTQEMIGKLYRPRPPFAHKGNFGHALLIAGSYGKMGAAVLAAQACLHTGAGLLTCLAPRCGYGILQTTVPEAMVLTDEQENLIAQLPDHIENYSVIGLGPGLGTADETRHLVSFLIRRYRKPLVIDADALNCLAQETALLAHLPPYSILTPHPKEFDRLFGPQENELARLETAARKAKELQVVLLVKGHHTLIATPGGTLYFNSTGNAGMAKGGSGDVLTGILTSLVAQQYAPETAAILGVYLHGLSGDLAAQALSQEAMTATDLVHFLSPAFLQLAAWPRK